VTSYVSAGEVDAGFVNATDAVSAAEFVILRRSLRANFYT